MNIYYNGESNRIDSTPRNRCNHSRSGPTKNTTTNMKSLNKNGGSRYGRNYRDRSGNENNMVIKSKGSIPEFGSWIGYKTDNKTDFFKFSQEKIVQHVMVTYTKFIYLEPMIKLLQKVTRNNCEMTPPGEKISAEIK